MKHSRKELLEQMRELAANLERVPKRHEMDENDGTPASGTYIREFGSWNDAVQKAGFQPTRRSGLSDDELLEMLRDVADDVGRTPSISDIRNHTGTPSASLYQSRFGSWSQAHRAAGLEPRTSITHADETLLQGIADLASEVGGQPTAEQMTERGPYSVRAYQRAFGSWTAALREAGFDPERHRYPTEELLDTLEQLAADLGRSPQVIDAIKDDDFPSEQVYYDRFGSWEDALEKAGLELPSGPEFTDNELLTELRELADERGRTPTMKEVRSTEDAPGPTTYKDHFGSWNEALSEADLEPVKRDHYTDEELLNALRELSDRVDGTPTMKEMDKSEDHPSSGVYQNQFGTWNAAVREAGLNPNQ